jgi:hypothetical protein
VSENNGSGALGTPFLNGYTVTWDAGAGEWVACSNTSDTVLRGKNQAELDTARWRLVVGLAEELRAVIDAAPGLGYSPPRFP